MTRFDRLMLVAIALAVVSAVVGLYVSFYLSLASGAAHRPDRDPALRGALVLSPRSGVFASRRVRPNAT